MPLIIGWIGFAILVGILGKERKIGFGGAFFLSLLLSPLIGLIIALVSDKKNPYMVQTVPNVSKYKEYKEAAEKEEFKGNIEKAIDLYMDALFHLEKDYKNLPDKSEAKRLETVSVLKSKVEELKLKV